MLDKNNESIVYFLWSIEGRMCICIYKCAAYSPTAQRESCSARPMDPKKRNQKTAVIPPIRVTEEEKERLLSLSQAHGLSLSEYMRQAGLAKEITHRTEVETVLQLARINADQARLGNLLKLALDHDNALEVEKLINEIRRTQQDLKAAVNRV